MEVLIISCPYNQAPDLMDSIRDRVRIVDNRYVYGENYYLVKEMAGQYTDISISRMLSISRERVRQLRIRASNEDPLAPRICTKCKNLFTPANRWRSTCGCKGYGKQS